MIDLTFTERSKSEAGDTSLPPIEQTTKGFYIFTFKLLFFCHVLMVIVKQN
jgi:hypothetical protein